MKVTIKTKSHPEEQTFICSGFEYPITSDEPWFILKDEDGDPAHMFATEDILYIGVEYSEESLPENKTEILNLELDRPITFL